MKSREKRNAVLYRYLDIKLSRTMNVRSRIRNPLKFSLREPASLPPLAQTRSDDCDGWDDSIENAPRKRPASKSLPLAPRAKRIRSHPPQHATKHHHLYLRTALADPSSDDVLSELVTRDADSDAGSGNRLMALRMMSRCIGTKRS